MVHKFKFVLELAEIFKNKFLDPTLNLLNLNIWGWKSLMYEALQEILIHAINGPVFGNHCSRVHKKGKRYSLCF